MRKNHSIYLILTLLACTMLCACQHEIQFDFPPTETALVIEGQVSNEDVFVRISHTRPLADTIKTNTVSAATVFLSSDDGFEEQLVFNEHDGCFRSPSGMVGAPGHTYRMRATVEGRDYEASSTMQPQAQVDTVYFRCVEALQMRLFFFCLKGVDPIPDERNYYLCRLMRKGEVFRWNPRSGRSSVNGTFEYDIPCSTQKDMDEGIDNDGKIPLMDGDTISLVLMTIDRPAWEYFQSMMVSDRTTTNPITNIKGGAQGVFMAANITRPEAVVFDQEAVVNQKDEGE